MTMVLEKRALVKKLKRDCQVCRKKNQDVGLVRINRRMVYICSTCGNKYSKERFDNRIKD